MRYLYLNRLLKLTARSSSLRLLVVCLTISSSIRLSFAEGETAFIQTRSASLQTEPRLLAKSLQKLSYGDSVQVVSSNADWSKVSTHGRSGYIHNSALSSRKLILSNKPGLENSTSDSDISLAGKGFSSEVEKQLAASNQALNFKAVDAMEKISITEKQTLSFIKAGKLNQEDL